MNIRLRFATDGGITFYKALQQDRVNHWRSMARPIKNWESEMIENLFEDEGRVRARMPDEEARAMSIELKRCFRTFIPESDANEWRWIKTEAGTCDLPARRDFECPSVMEDIMDVTAIPGCIFVALDDDICLYVYGWNHNIALRTDRKMITLNKGDVLVYRGDLIYGPVGYKTNKVCLHAYLDSPISVRPQPHYPILVPTCDNTVVNEDPFCFVWNCSFAGKETMALRCHLNRYHHFHFQHPVQPISP